MLHLGQLIFFNIKLCFYLGLISLLCFVKAIFRTKNIKEVMQKNENNFCLNFLIFFFHFSGQFLSKTFLQFAFFS